MPQATGSIEKLGPNRWRVRAQGRDPRTGRKVGRKKIVTGSKTQALRALDELKQLVRAGSKPQRLRLKTYARSWLASRAPALKPSVARKYATSLDLHVLPVLGDMYIDSLTHDDVQQYVNGRVASGASGNTVLNELRVIRTIARDSFAAGVAPRYWADRVKPPAVQGWSDEDPNMLTAEQLGRMLEHVPEQWQLLVGLMAFTGMRWGEVSALRWMDVDLPGMVIRIRRGNWKGREVDAPKTERSRRQVPIPWAMGAPLAEGWRATGGTGDALVFPSRTGGLHKGSPLRRVLEEACEAAGVPTITPHGLRRTWNDILRRVTSKEVAKEMIGHATDVMHGHYSRIDSNEKAEATRRAVALVGKKEG
jgi:integrase